MFKTWNLSCLRYNRALSFGHLSFENLKIVSNFDIRISDLIIININNMLQTSTIFCRCCTTKRLKWQITFSGLGAKGDSGLTFLNWAGFLEGSATTEAPRNPCTFSSSHSNPFGLFLHRWFHWQTSTNDRLEIPMQGIFLCICEDISLWPSRVSAALRHLSF